MSDILLLGLSAALRMTTCRNTNLAKRNDALPRQVSCYSNPNIERQAVCHDQSICKAPGNPGDGDEDVGLNL